MKLRCDELYSATLETSFRPPNTFQLWSEFCLKHATIVLDILVHVQMLHYLLTVSLICQTGHWTMYLAQQLQTINRNFDIDQQSSTQKKIRKSQQQMLQYLCHVFKINGDDDDSGILANLFRAMLESAPFAHGVVHCSTVTMYGINEHSSREHVTRRVAGCRERVLGRQVVQFLLD